MRRRHVRLRRPTLFDDVYRRRLLPELHINLKPMLEQQLESKSMELEMAQESAKELGVQAQTYASSAERLGGELASLQGQLDEMEDMNTRLEAAAAETANQRDEAQAQISSMEQREADLVQQVESLTADVETMRNASSGAEGLQASVAALEQQLASKESEVAELQQQSQTHASSAERLGGELASLQGHLDEMERT